MYTSKAVIYKWLFSSRSETLYHRNMSGFVPLLTTKILFIINVVFVIIL